MKHSVNFARKCAIVGLVVLTLSHFSTVLGVTAVHADTTATIKTTEIAESGQEVVVNTLVKNGYLQIDTEQQSVVITEKYKQTVISQTDTSLYNVVFTDNSVSIVPKYQFRSFSGVNKIVYTWKGYDIYLDSTNANRIAAGLGIGATLAALIPDPAASKIVAVALGVSAGLIAYNNAAGRGVIVAYVGLFPNGTAHWVSSQ